jgi:flagellar basal-body rod protein FlgB
MNPLSVTLIMKTLDGLSARAVATAENIANTSTPGYRPLRVTFETALQAAARTGDAARVAAVKLRLEEMAASSQDGQLRPDLELATATSTAMRYAALVEVLNRQLQLEGLAVRGNV